MIDLTANFQYAAADGRVTQQGPCRIQLDAQTFTLAPDEGAPISFDLGDLDGVVREPARVNLPLYTGSSIMINALGAAYERFVHDLLEAYRDRMAECLLVSDMKEVSRFDGTFEIGPRQSCASCGARARGTKFCTECGTALSTGTPTRTLFCTSCGAQMTGKFCSQCGTPVGSDTQQATRCGEAEFRLYESNLAILPTTSQAFQWRLAEIDAIHHEPNGYDVILDSGDLSMRVTGLGKRTSDFATRVREASRQVATNGARALHEAFPMLTPDQLQATAGLLREGRAVPMAKLAAIHPRITRAVEEKAVDKDLKPYFEALMRLSAGGLVHAGYRLIRREEEDNDQAGELPESDEQTDEQAENMAEVETADEDRDSNGNTDLATLYWFFFPIAKRPGSRELANLVAWEACSRSGRATYFFRLAKPADSPRVLSSSDSAAIVESSIRKLNAAMMTLNFRRRPIYLSENELEGDAQWRRYAIAARRIPELGDLRASFLGRAIHTSFDAWKVQVEKIIAKA